MAEGHRVSRHISRMCGRVGAGEPTFESYSVGKHSAAAPAVVSAHSQLSATRLATLLHAARRWVHLLLAQVGVCCRLVASPIALVELYRTGQVWHVGGGHGSRDRHPTTRSGTNVRISQTSPTYDWTLPPSGWIPGRTCARSTGRGDQKSTSTCRRDRYINQCTE